MGVKQISALSGRSQKGTVTLGLKIKSTPSPMAFTLSPISLNVKMAWQELGLALFEACGYFRIIQRFYKHCIGEKGKLLEMERNCGKWNHCPLPDSQRALMLLL